MLPVTIIKTIIKCSSAILITIRVYYKLYRFLTVYEYMGSYDHEAIAEGLYTPKPCI